MEIDFGERGDDLIEQVRFIESFYLVVEFEFLDDLLGFWIELSNVVLEIFSQILRIVSQRIERELTRVVNG